ncbi:MAG: hypothetical protein ABSB74_17260 [Tepidisphaeraceae bacterium]|jgi:hypothetical protein
MEHAVPSLLKELLAAGKWPTDAKTAMAQNLRCLVTPERVHRFAAEEDRIYLMAPPFRTIAVEVASADEVPDIFFDEVSEVPIFVITAY